MTRDALRSAAIGAVLAAAFVAALFAVRPLPYTVLHAVGVHGGLDLRGGMRLEYVLPPGVDPAAAAAELARRIDRLDPGARIERHDRTIVIEVPGVPEAEVGRTAAILTTGGVQFQIVDSAAPVMSEIFARASRDPHAAELGITASPDSWVPEQGGRRTDYYLSAEDPRAIIQWLEDSGIQLPADREIRFEHVEPSQYEPDRRAYWRSYYLVARIELDSSSIRAAEKSFDPQTGRPIVLLDFDRAGAERFGDLTAANVGNKLATILGGDVKSAPIINGPIRGGRCSITMGAGDVAAQEREADALVATLQVGVLPPGGELTAADYVARSVPPSRLWLARAILGALAGAGAFALIFLVGRRTERVPAEPPAGAATRPAPWSRLLVTLTALLAVWVAWSIPMPTINDVDMEMILVRSGRLGIDTIGAFSLRLGPLIGAFVVVELIALAVPSWRRARLTPAGRRRMARAVVVGAVVVAAAQGWLLARAYHQLEMSWSDLESTRTLEQSAVIAITCAGATLCLGVVAAAISEYGLGNGFSTVIVAAAVVDLAGELMSYRVGIGGATAALALTTIALVAAITTWLVRRRVATGTPAPIAAPVAGLIPLVWPIAIVPVIATLALLGVHVPWSLIDLAHPDTVTGHVVFAMVIAAVTIGLGWLMTRPDAHAALLARMTETKVERPVRAWRWAVVVSAAAVIALYAIGVAVAPVAGLPVFDVLVVATAAAVVLDHVAAWRAHRRADLVGVWPIHQAGMAEVARAVLARAGIDAHLRGRHHRALLHVAGPFVPIEVMVPAERAGEATAILRDMFDPAARGVTSAW